MTKGSVKDGNTIGLIKVMLNNTNFILVIHVKMRNHVRKDNVSKDLNMSTQEKFNRMISVNLCHYV